MTRSLVSGAHALSALLALLTLTATTRSSAQPGSSAGAGKRRVDTPATTPANSPAPSSTAAEPPKPDKPLTHKVGPPPRRPAPRLPDGVPRAKSAAAKASVGDPQLEALRQAEKSLFPKPLRGATPGFRWSTPDVDASGLPPSAKTKRPGAKKSDARDAAWLSKLTLPNFPVKLDPRVVKYLKFYKDNSRGKAIARIWAKKSGKYAPALRAELAKLGLPTDLVWLSLIESGHNPRIMSPVGAAGLWQFMPGTGRHYGLTVDRWVDERLDPERSTHAAAQYLSHLYKRFRSWDLAMAAYNMGGGGLSRSIRKYNSNDFWELSRYESGLPWETSLYVPKIAAIAIVMSNRKVFGIANITPDAPERFDVVKIGGGVHLNTVASAAGVDASTVRALNPQLLTNRTPPNPKGKRRTHDVRLPVGAGAKAARALAKLKRGSSLRTYRVRFGDTAESIAEATGMSEAKLRHRNAIGRSEKLRRGTLLLVSAGTPKAKTEKPLVVVPPRTFAFKGKRRVFYPVRSGDTLQSVAGAFGVTRSQLVLWNSIDQRAKLLPSMVLQVWVDRNHSLQDVRHYRESGVDLLISGTPAFHEHFEAQRGRQRLSIVVQRGDTLTRIARRYGLTVGQMERINRISRSATIKAGQRLIVYVRSKAKATTSTPPEAAVALAKPIAPRPDLLPGAAATPTSRPGG